MWATWEKCILNETSTKICANPHFCSCHISLSKVSLVLFQWYSFSSTLLWSGILNLSCFLLSDVSQRFHVFGLFWFLDNVFFPSTLTVTLPRHCTFSVCIIYCLTSILFPGIVREKNLTKFLYYASKTLKLPSQSPY